MFRMPAVFLLLIFIFPLSAFSQEIAETIPPHAIINASYVGDEKTVRELLAAGVDKDARDALGASALHLATMHTNHIIIKLLLDHGFNPNIRAEKSGNTPLHYAVAANNIGAVQLLIQYQANRNLRNLEGLTPLEKARREGKDDIARILYR